ncbi:hypothetical protein BDV96DRAFT_674772 [Lophiotrema nucula]|uniref:Alpha/Beta hydrolase protein n=1 Tax=Lophiotrema nucula TaxID=690887 RepID=A0A6A5YIF1_9PLEO|nr:hypothetical protein BDV96DRAFT_674772 [Lophiotrema nucula]
MPKPRELATSIHLHATPASQRQPKRTYLIYFIPGNPGLIEFYRTFLTHLYGLLTAKLATEKDVEFQIYGRSLSGFETSRAQIDEREKEKELEGKRPPYDVEQQIAITERHVKNAVQKLKSEGCGDVRLILMGHSLGTYISMEILRRLRSTSQNPADSVRVVGGICLFTTITNLAGSPNGKKLGHKAQWFVSPRHAPHLIHALVKLLTLLLPTRLLAFFIHLFDGQPPDTAHVTASHIKSPLGMRQMLHLAQDELHVISKDKWDEEVWGAAAASGHPHPRPVLRFLFGGKDGWVANETRDELIKARGGSGSGDDVWKPKMEVDEKEGWPHDFCVRHSVPVAERVYGYVEDIVKADLERG